MRKISALVLTLFFFFSFSTNAFATTFTDDFNRSDNTSLGSNWTEFTGNLDIVSNVLKTTGLGGTYVWAESLYNTPTSSEDQYCQFVFNNSVSSSNRDNMGCLLRSNNAKNTYYAVFFYDNNSGADSNKYYIYRFNSGTLGVVNSGTSLTFTPAEGDTLKVEITTGASTVDFAFYQNGVLKTSYSDSSVSRITASDKKVGLLSRVTNTTFDDFEGGDIAPPPSPTPSPSPTPTPTPTPSPILPPDFVGCTGFTNLDGVVGTSSGNEGYRVELADGVLTSSIGQAYCELLDSGDPDCTGGSPTYLYSNFVRHAVSGFDFVGYRVKFDPTHQPDTIQVRTSGNYDDSQVVSGPDEDGYFYFYKTDFSLALDPFPIWVSVNGSQADSENISTSIDHIQYSLCTGDPSPELTTDLTITDYTVNPDSSINMSVAGTFSYGDVFDEDLCRIDFYDKTNLFANYQPKSILANAYVLGEFSGATLGELPPAFDKLPPTSSTTYLATGNVRDWSVDISVYNDPSTPFELGYKVTCFYSDYDFDTGSITSYDPTGTFTGLSTSDVSIPDEEIGVVDECAGTEGIESLVCQTWRKFTGFIYELVVPDFEMVTNYLVPNFIAEAKTRDPIAYAFILEDAVTSATTNDLAPTFNFGDVPFVNYDADIPFPEPILDFFEYLRGFLHYIFLGFWFIYVYYLARRIVL